MRSGGHIVATALLAAACAVPAPDGEAPPVEVQVDGPVKAWSPAYVAAADLPDRTRAVAANVAAVWGAGPDVLDGWRIVWRQEPFDCGSASDGDHTVGCTRWSEREVDVLVFAAGCPEATVLPHEVGHVVLGDAAHRDPRWCDRAFWGRVREALQATAPADCDLSRVLSRNVDVERCGADADDD